MKAGTLTLLLGYATVAGATPVETLDDIRLWVGEGANRAAIAVDWDGASSTDQALVWGYRWDGAATGEDALRAVAAADPRFYLKISGGSTGFGVAVIGIGYDLNGDGAFAISDNTLFDADGIANTAPSDGATPLAGDLYVEGWEDGYWHYGLRAAGGEWTSSQTGVTQRVLTDGDQDSFAFAVTLNFDEYAQNLVAAPPVPQAGDFNADGSVDAADYTVWRDTLGQPGGLTTADYDLWAQAYIGALQPAITIPEPAAHAAGVLAFALMATGCPRTNAERRPGIGL